MQSECVNSQEAACHLEMIRTLMERTALYRRALAPVMIAVGIIGCTAAGIGWEWLGDISANTFVAYWLSVALIVIAVVLGIIRRQALSDHEPFWSLPTRRVVESMLPSLLIGMFAAVMMSALNTSGMSLVRWLPGIWMVQYGIALHGAGFFTLRGIRLFGCIVLSIGAGLLVFEMIQGPGHTSTQRLNAIMGFGFGLSHLACGIYLILREKTARP